MKLFHTAFKPVTFLLGNPGVSSSTVLHFSMYMIIMGGAHTRNNASKQKERLGVGCGGEKSVLSSILFLNFLKFLKF